MRLYNYAGSANGYKVELLLALLGRSYERVEVPIFDGASRTPAFLAKNPAGRIPVLELDDGRCLPESNAILWHLARDTAFVPETPADEDRVLAWLMFEQSEVEPVIGSARFWMQTGRARERRDELGRRLSWAKQTLATLERELADKAFLVGDRASIADLAIYAYVHLAPEIDLPLGPHVTAWCARLAALPGFIPSALRYDASAMAASVAPVAPVSPSRATEDSRYDTRMDNKYGYSTTIDIPVEVAAHEPWFNQTLTQVNDSLLRLGIFGGEYHWHKHDNEDECFVVLDGELELDIEGSGTVTLGPQRGYTVPKGVVHRTRAKAKTVVLMIESASVTPTGD
ncbi:MAG: glutathione S-transferase N-terminal domain-containing protein [Kofleriaceae bacterium]